MVHVAIFDDTADVPPVKHQWGWPKIVSHWNFPDRMGKPIKLVTYTNCEEVELLINGESCGTKDLAGCKNQMMTWNAVYIPGSVRAVGRRKGKSVCDFELKTAAAPKGLVLKPDKTSVVEHVEPDAGTGTQIIHIEACIVDEHGTLCPFASHRVRFDVAGPAVLKCLDNGDMMGDELFSEPELSMNRGRALAILQTEPIPEAREAGDGADAVRGRAVQSPEGVITVTAEAEGLEPGKCEIAFNTNTDTAAK